MSYANALKAQMSITSSYANDASAAYEMVMEQVRALPEDCLEDVSKYMNFLIYQHNINKMNSLVESENEFNAKMLKGYDDMVQGRVKPLKDAFSDIKRRFA